MGLDKLAFFTFVPAVVISSYLTYLTPTICLPYVALRSLNLATNVPAQIDP